MPTWARRVGVCVMRVYMWYCLSVREYASARVSGVCVCAYVRVYASVRAQLYLQLTYFYRTVLQIKQSRHVHHLLSITEIVRPHQLPADVQLLRSLL